MANALSTKTASRAPAMPQYERGPCQAPGEETGDICGETRSSCWYGAARKGIHFCYCLSHRVAWQDFKRNGAAILDDEVNSEIADGYATGSSARRGVAVGDLPTSSVSAPQLVLEQAGSAPTLPYVPRHCKAVVCLRLLFSLLRVLGLSGSWFFLFFCICSLLKKTTSHDTPISVTSIRT